jgi:hypothetical protein
LNALNIQNVHLGISPLEPLGNGFLPKTEKNNPFSRKHGIPAQKLSEKIDWGGILSCTSKRSKRSLIELLCPLSNPNTHRSKSLSLLALANPR